MLGAGMIIKLGVPGAAGFLLGLLALAVIRPQTAEGKALLVLTMVCLAIVISNVVGFVVKLARGGGGGGGDDKT